MLPAMPYVERGNSYSGHTHSMCSTVLLTLQVRQVTRKSPTPILWERRVCPVRSREMTRCSRREVRSSQAAVDCLIFLKKGERWSAHSVAQRVRKVFPMNFLTSSRGAVVQYLVSACPAPASLSADSLPGIPQCPGIHAKEVLAGTLFRMA